MYKELLSELGRVVAEIDYRMQDGSRISRAELSELKALADRLTGVIETYEIPILKLIRED